MNCSSERGGVPASAFSKAPKSGVLRQESADAALEVQGMGEEPRREGSAADRDPPALGYVPLMAG